MENSKVIAAKDRYDNDDAPETLYVTSDNQCFDNELGANNHAVDLVEDSSVVNVTTAHCDLYDALLLAETTGACDTALEDSELEDDFAAGLVIIRKKEIVEAARVAEKLAYIEDEELAMPGDETLLNLLLHGEENQDVIDAINAILNP